jgi:hypothetical protein
MLQSQRGEPLMAESPQADQRRSILKYNIGSDGLEQEILPAVGQQRRLAITSEVHASGLSVTTAEQEVN